MTTTIGTLPDAATIASFSAGVVRVERWADVYESDNSTLWRSRIPISAGSVTVDMERSERRALDLTIHDIDQNLGYGPDAFWYDKFIWLYRGITFANGDKWVAPLGQFMPDTINRLRFPQSMQVTGRDLTKKMMKDRFPDTTAFASGSNIGTVISTIATNAGILNQVFSTVSQTLAEDIVFDRGSSRWDAAAQLAQSINHELFFNASGQLVLRPWVDPTTAPVSFTFEDTPGISNLVDYQKSTSDARLFNHVVVFGSGQDNALVFAEATNTDPSSPTRIGKIGRRMMDPIGNAFVQDNTAAQAIADAILAVAGLEQFDMNFSSIVFPWLEVGDAVEIYTEQDVVGDPNRFLLANLTIPLGLEAMSGNGRRVTNVG